MKNLLAALCLVGIAGCDVESSELEPMHQDEEVEVAQPEEAGGGACTLTCVSSTGWVGSGCPSGQYCVQTADPPKGCYIGDEASESVADDNVPLGTTVDGKCVGKAKMNAEESLP